MRKVTEIPPAQDHRPIELRHLRVAAYCRISTELEEQTDSIELQERYYSQLITENPYWENTEIFSPLFLSIVEVIRFQNRSMRYSST